MLAKIKCNRAARIHFNQGSTNSFLPAHPESRIPDYPKSLLILDEAIPCVELFRDIAPTTDANFDVCCNKTGDCQINQDSSFRRKNDKLLVKWLKMFERAISKKSSSGYDFNTPLNNSFDLFQPESQSSMFDICLDSSGSDLDRNQFRKFWISVIVEIRISNK